MASREFVKVGEYYSADYLRLTDLDSSRTFSTMFKLVRENNKSTSDSDVISNIKMFGRADVSEVFRVADQNPKDYYVSALYANNQTGTIIAPAPGDGKRIVAISAFIRTNANSGLAYFSDGVQTLMYTQFSAQNSAAAASIIVPMTENAAVTVTSTQGANNLYCAVGYYIETIKAQ